MWATTKQLWYIAGQNTYQHVMQLGKYTSLEMAHNTWARVECSRVVDSEYTLELHRLVAWRPESASSSMTTYYLVYWKCTFDGRFADRSICLLESKTPWAKTARSVMQVSCMLLPYLHPLAKPFSFRRRPSAFAMTILSSSTCPFHRSHSFSAHPPSLSTELWLRDRSDDCRFSNLGRPVAVLISRGRGQGQEYGCWDGNGKMHIIKVLWNQYATQDWSFNIPLCLSTQVWMLLHGQIALRNPASSHWWRAKVN